MGKCLLLSLILLLMVKSPYAQPNLPQTFELRTDTAQAYILSGSYTQMLEDPKEQFTIEQVVSPSFSSPFHASHTSHTGVDRSIRHYWMRFRIHNQLNQDVVLYFDSPLLFTELYKPKENGG